MDKDRELDKEITIEKSNEQILQELKQVGINQFQIEEYQKKVALSKKHRAHKILQKALQKKAKKKRRK